jgi:REP element-mobilizing transposase RayT
MTPSPQRQQGTSAPPDMAPLAYHIIWTTYGSWLPGDHRGWVKKNVKGIQDANPRLEASARKAMAQDQVVLTGPQRTLVEKTIREHCRIRDWKLHALNVRSNHVHVVVAAGRDPDDVMGQLKAWCSRKLSDAAGLENTVAVKAGRRHWFTEGGDKEIIASVEYLERAIQYVVEGQGA